ncbi:MAG TPA: NAD(P)-dependent oxidoreductase [Acidimicrobiia bacterium]|nr:NAD(P)-dependent oxidoreductase [Acidimicrobiia bacterium]
MEPIGFVGLGEMGLPMARTLLRAGFRIRACDRRPEAAAAAERAGALAAATLSDLAVCPVVALVVVSDAQVATAGRELVTHLQPGAVIVVHSTVLPETVTSLAAAAAVSGVDVLDAPVSGAVMAAERGELAIMAGGPEPVLQRCRPVLDALGRVIPVGAVGSGQVVKLLNNMLQAGHRLLQCEAIEVAARCGIDEATVRAVLAASSGGSWTNEHWEHLDRQFLEHTLAGTDAFMSFLTKDPHHAMQLARGLGLEPPVMATVDARVEEAYAARIAGLLTARRRPLP